MDIYQELISGYRGYGRYLWYELTHPSWNNYLYWLLGISLFFFLWELWRPWKKQQKIWRSQFWLDFFYMFFNFFLFSLIGYHAISNVFVKAFNGFLQNTLGIENWVAFEIASWSVALQLLTLFVVRDFIQWNIHRLLHRVPALWQFHKVHHSAKEMGFATHLRFHWMETVVYRTLEYIPLGMIGFGIQEFFVVHLFALTIGHFNHSNIRLPLGFFKYLFNNPQMHTWHHAKHLPKGKGYGVNFGLSLSLWDYLFGTAYVPNSGQNTPLGFDGDEDFPQTFWGQVKYGFFKSRRSSKGGG